MYFNPDADLDTSRVVWLVPNPPTSTLNSLNPLTHIERGFHAMYDILAVFGTAGITLMVLCILFFVGGLAANYSDNHRVR